MKVRIKFSKHGVMKFIGHLDVLRYFQKSMRRAKIDIAYSGGYSPHQIMTFAAPLGVGLESDGEYMDIEVNSAIGGAKSMMDALNKVMVEGIEIKSVKALPEHAGNAMASVAAAGYLVHFRDNKLPEICQEANLSEFMNKNSVMIIKKTKKSETEYDIRPSIYELKEKNGDVYMMVDASSSGNIKPAMVLQALFKEKGMDFMPEWIQIIREETYMNMGTKENVDFVPLENAGEDF